MKTLLFGCVLMVLTGCATVSYLPPAGAVSDLKLALRVSSPPRILTLGPYSLRQERGFDEHGDLPFVEDGGTYTTRAGSDYIFQGPDYQTRVTIVRDAEITVNPGGRWLATLSTLTVRISGDHGPATESRAQRGLGTVPYLDFPERKMKVLLDFQGISEGKTIAQWNQPTALVVQQDGQVAGYLSLVLPSVFYSAKDGPAELSPEAALAALAAWESVKGWFEAAPVNLPTRTY